MKIIRGYLQILLCVFLFLLATVNVYALENDDTDLYEQEQQSEPIVVQSVVLMIDNSSSAQAVFDQEKAFAMALINELGMDEQLREFTIIPLAKAQSSETEEGKEDESQPSAFVSDPSLIISELSLMEVEEEQSVTDAFAYACALKEQAQAPVTILYLGSVLYTNEIPALPLESIFYGFTFTSGMEEDARIYTRSLMQYFSTDEFCMEFEDTASMYAALESVSQAVLSSSPLCEKEEAAQPDEQESQEESIEPQIEKRYTVLVLDVSGSMQGEPLQTLKSSVASFCESLLQDEVEDEIALVTFDTKASVICSFTSDYQALYTAINRVQVGNLTNLYAGLAQAQSLIEQIPAAQGVYKNVVICTDGLPSCGLQMSEGLFSAADGAQYAYTNGALSVANMLKNEAYVYTIGSFDTLQEDENLFARTFMQEMASDNQYYQASASYFLQLAFSQIASGIISNQNLNSGLENPVSLQVKLEKESMCVGQSQQLSAWFMPNQDWNLTYSSSDESIALIDESGRIEALKPGTVSLSVQSENGLSSSVTITIYGKYDIRRFLGWL